MDECINKLVICSKKPKKRAKTLCTVFRKLFLPNTTYKLKDKNVSVRRYKSLGEDLKMSHFIVTADNYIKIGQRPNGPTFTFSIEEFEEKMKIFSNAIYSTDPLITITGESKYNDFFTNLSHPNNTPERNINFHFENDFIQIRHYKIETVEEENIKVGLTEIGPRLTLRIKKIEEDFFPI
ncbi:brix domain protein [Vairimorpha ceranae]|uniref:Brix domain protein n=1 Tax=Vairimorpha ceranae TaxID=40302 RepID=A0A0F9YPZ1_9MICR|nr:brix domain protein [Vairimorpha ceranae]KAF5141614.1 hypothetical protein G9O61_00g001560 [Vairimorpha ceranae]KKO74727.1 brix domain protein [Vairimorpha ceranae]